MPKHVGIVDCSAEGAALCQRTLCAEAPAIRPDNTIHQVSDRTVNPW